MMFYTPARGLREVRDRAPLAAMALIALVASWNFLYRYRAAVSRPARQSPKTGRYPFFAVASGWFTGHSCTRLLPADSVYFQPL